MKKIILILLFVSNIRASHLEINPLPYFLGRIDVHYNFLVHNKITIGPMATFFNQLSSGATWLGGAFGVKGTIFLIDDAYKAGWYFSPGIGYRLITNITTIAGNASGNAVEFYGIIGYFFPIKNNFTLRIGGGAGINFLPSMKTTSSASTITLPDNGFFPMLDFSIGILL